MSTDTRLADSLYEYVAAGFPGLWVESYEHEDACTEIRELCDENGWVYLQWDCINGLAKWMPSEDGQMQLARVCVERNEDPRAVHPLRIRPQKPEEKPQIQFDQVIQGLSVTNCDEQGLPIADQDGEDPTYALLVVKNIHGFVGALPVRQLLSNALWEARAHRQVLIGLTHTRQIPEEVEKMFQIIEHPLPDRPQLMDIAKSIAVEEGELPEDQDELDRVIDAASGLTRMEAEGAYSLSLVREETIVPRPVFELKSNMLKKGTGALSLYRGEETFDKVGGQSHLKTFCLETLAHREENPLFRPKGVMLMGVSGGGKSLFAKALGREVNRPTLICDIGAVMGRYVGQSEENIRKMLRVADAMAPCILMIDEVEKALSGVGSSGSSDSGVKAGIFGTLLTWMNDHQSDVYMIVTCNDITKLTQDNPEFARQGRFDGLFFVDFPGRESKDQIWDIHLRNYGFLKKGQPLTDLGQDLPEDEDMTGAEIEAICRLARLRRRPLSDVGKTMPRIVDQAAETIEAARTWATGRCWAADYEALYDKTKHAKKLASVEGGKPGGARRKVVRRRHS